MWGNETNSVFKSLKIKILNEILLKSWDEGQVFRIFPNQKRLLHLNQNKTSLSTI
jgi:hypothetical protein